MDIRPVLVFRENDRRAMVGNVFCTLKLNAVSEAKDDGGDCLGKCIHERIFFLPRTKVYFPHKSLSQTPRIKKYFFQH